MSAGNLTRRLFLRHSVTGALATAVAAPSAITAPSAFERARYHMDQFAAAMDELTVGYHGWLVQGAGHRRQFSHPGCRTIEDSSWVKTAAVRYETGTEPRCPSLIKERHHEIIGLQKQPYGWLEEPMCQDEDGVRL